MIRRASPADASRVNEVVQAAYAKWVPVLGRRPRPMDDDYSKVIAENDVWLDEDGDVVRGTIVLQPEDDHLWVDNVAVHPSASGVGLGKVLLDHAEKRAGELGVSEMWLFTHELMSANRAIYLHLGWSEFEPEDRLDAVLVYFRKSANA